MSVIKNVSYDKSQPGKITRTRRSRKPLKRISKKLVFSERRVRGVLRKDPSTEDYEEVYDFEEVDEAYEESVTLRYQLDHLADSYGGKAVPSNVRTGRGKQARSYEFSNAADGNSFIREAKKIASVTEVR